MPDSTHDSDHILAAARGAVARQRAGGPRAGRSLGAGSARLKARHRLRQLRNMAIATVGVLIAAIVAGLAIGGLGFEGVLATVLALLAAWLAAGLLTRLEVPRRADLQRGDLVQTVARTELWLERQRPALPAPAVPLLDHIGTRLDGLGAQLRGLDQTTPAAAEIRRLVGDHLPEIVDSYTAIPAHLRDEPRAGVTPDEQLTHGLKRISGEIDSVTRQLAEGALDELAVRSRYLDYRYGGDVAALPDAGARDLPLPSASPDRTALPAATPPNTEKE